MRVYYQTDRVTLYHGDCLEVLPRLEAGSVDAVVTDPPYRVKRKVELRGKGVAPQKQISTTIGEQGWTLGKDWIAHAAKVCVSHIVSFGGYLDLAELLADRGQGELRGVFTWVKSNAPLPAWNVPRYDTEFAVWFGRGPNPANIRSLNSMVFNCAFPPAGCFASERLVDTTGKALHPAQKPLKVMLALVEAFAVEDATVLDPFAGSGTTGVACLQTGRRFIGVELDERYAEIAARRLEKAAEVPPLFAAADATEATLFP